ncbi:PH domain-containing protein [Plantactinospora sp. WMMB782]|uniref:PH domain-containing protein n=1 Tax=Plantactinospora sp. WMMB782 TaxID=3404121 RepID=UPI003B926473
MRPLPATYRMPKDMIGYFVVLTVFVMLPVGFAALGTGLPGWLSALILFGTLGLLLGVGLRVSRMGTVVEADGMIRRGFLGDRRYAWSDIRDFYLHDNRGVTRVGPFDVTSRYVVAVYDHQHQRRRRTLFFLDERAFPGPERFLVELQEIIQLWEQRRGQPRATV